MDTETPETTTTKVKTPRRSGKLLIAQGVVQIDGAEYRVGDLPNNARDWAMFSGIRRYILAAKSPADAWADLVAGKLPSDDAGKVKELDPWRRAYGHAWADKQAKDRGIKAKSPEYATLLDEGMQQAAGIDAQTMRKARTISAVVSHWNRITGNEATL